MKLRIEKMVYGGAGLTHAPEGETVFVPFTLPGELVETLPTEDNISFTEASLPHVLSSSPSRVPPGCMHFGLCGGCHYQHASYPAQVEIKRAILRETLERAGMTALPTIQAHTGAPWNYRNRSRLRVDSLESANGELRVGYNRRTSNRFLPIHECPISAPLIWRAAEALMQIARENSVAGRWANTAVEVEFFISNDSKLQMTVYVHKAPVHKAQVNKDQINKDQIKRDQPGFSQFCDRMRQLIPELIGAGAFLLTAVGPQRRAQKPRPLSSWGAPGLTYRVADEDYWISRGAFFQVNRFLLDELLAIVTSGRAGKTAWDLYAGAGLFSRILARTFEQVVAVEAAGTDLVNTFKGPGRRAVETTTLDFLRSAILQRERPELIVLDPPRAGIGDEVCALLQRIAAPEIVYVSCDPISLARDLAILTRAGYAIATLHMVDLFPQTFHLESVVVLRK